MIVLSSDGLVELLFFFIHLRNVSTHVAPLNVVLGRVFRHWPNTVMWWIITTNSPVETLLGSKKRKCLKFFVEKILEKNKKKQEILEIDVFY
jgi:hypothetical protein